MRKELEGVAETELDSLIISHMEAVADVVKTFDLEEKVKGIAYEAALLHDIGKLKVVKDSFFQDYDNKGNFRLSLLHSVTGAAYLQQPDNEIIKSVQQPESVIKVIACHSPYYLTEEELEDLGSCSLPHPLPRWDSYKDQGYSLHKLSLSIKKLDEDERLAAQALILADHSVSHDKHVGVDERLKSVFTRYANVISEEGTWLYEQRVREIEKKIKVIS